MSAEPESDDRLILSGRAVVGMCALWACIWLVSALVFGQDFSTCQRPRVIDQASSEQVSLRRYRQKLRRIFLYASAATAAGLVMFVHALSMPAPLKDLLVGFRLEHQVFSAMAIAHYTIHCWEDWRTRSLMGQGLSKDSAGGMALFPLNLCLSPEQIMLLMYLLHHSVSVFAFVYCLATHELSGVIEQGLIFELPVILMLRREIGTTQDPPPAWLQQERSVHCHWGLTYVFFLLGRLPAEGLWIASFTLSYERRLVDQLLSTRGLVIFHTLAAFFTVLNIRIVGLLMTWHAQDAQRARLQQQTQDKQWQQQPATAAAAGENVPEGVCEAVTLPTE